MEYSKYTAAPGLGAFSRTYRSFQRSTQQNSVYYENELPMVFEAAFCLDPGLPELARVGIMAEIPASYTEVSWFGEGPHESYPDRREAAFLGRYKHSIPDFEVPYVVPQENGNRGGVRNLTLINRDSSKNITICFENPVNINCSRYSLENQWESLHTCDLKDLTHGSEGKWFLYIDITQRGVGTATCGPDTREEYKVRGGFFKIKMYIY